MSKSNPDDNYTNVILEEVRDQNKAILELVGFLSDKVNIIEVDMQEVKADVSTLKLDMQDVKLDMQEVKADVSTLKLDMQEVKDDAVNSKSEINQKLDVILDAVGGQQIEIKSTLKDHEGRITSLETVVA